jgi:PilZ domain
MTNKMEGRSPTGGSPEYNNEKRREKRYDIPDACRQDIKLRVKNGNEFVPAILANVSRNGILFECPVSFSKGMQTECILSISLRLAQEISFVIEVRYCYADNGSHITGASIVSISDEVWFDVFVEAHDLIVLNKGSE